jgi:hypothetical protein
MFAVLRFTRSRDGFGDRLMCMKGTVHEGDAMIWSILGMCSTCLELERGSIQKTNDLRPAGTPSQLRRRLIFVAIRVGSKRLSP